MIIRKERITPEMRERFQALERASSRRGRGRLKVVPVRADLRNSEADTLTPVITMNAGPAERTVGSISNVPVDPEGNNARDWTGARERVLAMYDQIGHVSTVVLGKNGESVLVKEISSQYPGGWFQFAGDLQAQYPDMSISRKRLLSWTKPGFTDEQNLQLGINNIQMLFLERFPQFKELFEFDEDGKIREDQRSAARAFLMENLVSYRRFTSVMGSRFLNQNTAPYFKGSHFKAVKESFEPLGIEFDDIEFKDISVSGRGRWNFLRENPEIRDRIIEKEIEKCVAEGIKLTKRGLKEAGKTALFGIIETYYDGGLRALRDKFEEAKIKNRKPKGFWKSLEGQELMREEAKAILDKYKTISQNLLRRSGKGYIHTSAAESYTGGWAQLLIDIGYQTSRKTKYAPKGFWKTTEGQDEMRSRGKAFIEGHRSITKKLLIQNGQTDLLGAIVKDYPGGWKQFLKDVDFSESDKAHPHGFWKTAEGQKKMIEEGRAFLIEHGSITQKLLKKFENYYLYGAVFKFYEGGWKQFLKDIDAPEPADSWSLLKDNPEEMARVIEEEAEKCRIAGIKLTRSSLLAAGQNKLADRIKRYYPGSFRGLNNKLTESTRPPNGFWVSDEGQERIRDEAKEFLKTYGNITASLVDKEGKRYVYSLAYNYYSGGWSQLLIDIGVASKPTTDLQELSPESKRELLDGFAQFIASYPNSKTSLLEYAIKYMKGRS